MYTVIAFDTDYGVATEWTFDSKEAAESWVQALLFDYGLECQAHIVTR